MRITRETLLQAARNQVAQRIRADRSLIAIYVVGSLLNDSALLGGTADIDLVFVHNNEPEAPREVARLSPEVTLDIAHHAQTLYNQPRHLRLSPWVGASLCQTRIVLHDVQHWFEFTQSSVNSQFSRPDYIIARARQMLEAARQAWLGLPASPADHVQDVLAYLKSLELASNAIAVLTGVPLTERRFLLAYPERTNAIHRPGLNSGLLGLLGAAHTTGEQVKAWIPQWSAAMQAVEGLDNLPIRLHPSRRAYYAHAFEALATDAPAAALWPMLRTWTLASACLPAAHPQLETWQQACAALQLGPDQFNDRLAGLDAYLDTIDEALEAWAKENGA